MTEERLELILDTKVGGTYAYDTKLKQFDVVKEMAAEIRRCWQEIRKLENHLLMHDPNIKYHRNRKSSEPCPICKAEPYTPCKGKATCLIEDKP